MFPKSFWEILIFTENNKGWAVACGRKVELARKRNVALPTATPPVLRHSGMIRKRGYELSVMRPFLDLELTHGLVSPSCGLRVFYGVVSLTIALNVGEPAAQGRRKS